MNAKSRRSLATSILVLACALPGAARAQPAALSESDALEIGTEAYIYFYPLVTMDITRKVMTNVPPGAKDGLGPPNAFQHFRAYPTATMREVVRPNFDTLYSSAWLDLRKQPLVVTVPDTAGRYYLLPMLDMWTDVFAAPGKRTSGTNAASWALVPPGWSGTLPPGLERIDAPTPFVWIIGRTQTNGPGDYQAVHSIQDGYKVTPLSQLRRAAEPEKFVPDPAVDMKTDPLSQVNNMSAANYFAYAAELMKVNPPHPSDWSTIARLKRIGIEPGRSFDLDKAPPAVKAALERAPAEGMKRMKSKIPTLARVANGWQMNTDTMGVYGDFYLKRAVVAMVGLGANQPEDAIYPMNITDAEGQPMTGENKYVLHFAKEELPPVEAFWSVTMYDSQGFQVPNRLNRFAIGDRDNLKFNPDGSLDLYIQSDSPGSEKESNWLPSPPTGALGVTMRLYAPRPQAIDGRWNPPPVQQIK